MSRTTLMTATIFAGLATAALAQAPEPGDETNTAPKRREVQQRTEIQAREPAEAREQDRVREEAQSREPVRARDQGTVASRDRGRFVDADGDGICDNYQGRAGGAGQGRGSARGRRGRGPGDGTGNGGVGPRDGSGYGPGAGSGACDGTGPKGRAARGGRR